MQSHPPSVLTQPVGWGTWLRRQLSAADDDGYFGPGSAIWRVHREAVLGIGLGRAIFLQLAHPWVAQGIADHSTFRENALDRLAATITAAELLVFGSRAQADATAAHIRAIHTRIHGTLSQSVGRWPAGTPYSAEDPEALLWVLVTVMDTALVIYDLCFGPIPDELAGAYLADGAALGEMIGVLPGTVPPTRSALTAYMEEKIADGTIAVGPTAREMGAHLVRPGMPLDMSLLMRPYSSVTRATAAILIPPAIQRQFSPVLDVPAAPVYRAGGLIARRLLRRLPPRLRIDPIAARALVRAGQS